MAGRWQSNSTSPRHAKAPRRKSRRVLAHGTPSCHRARRRARPGGLAWRLGGWREGGVLGARAARVRRLARAVTLGWSPAVVSCRSAAPAGYRGRSTLGCSGDPLEGQVILAPGLPSGRGTSACLPIRGPCSAARPLRPDARVVVQASVPATSALPRAGLCRPGCWVASSDQPPARAWLPVRYGPSQAFVAGRETVGHRLAAGDGPARLAAGARKVDSVGRASTLVPGPHAEGEVQALPGTNHTVGAGLGARSLAGRHH